MRNKFSAILITFLCMGATSDTTHLATSSLETVESSLAVHEKRTEALQKLTQQFSSSAEAPIAENEQEQIAQQEPQAATSQAFDNQSALRRRDAREGEESFAKRLAPVNANTAQDKRSRLAQLIDAVSSGAQTIDVLEEFVDDHPAYRDARLALARIQLMRAAPAKAVITLKPLTTPLLQSDHPDWQAWFWRGSARLAMDELEAARQDLEIALAKNKNQVVIWIQLAVVEQELDNHAAALQYLDIAQQIDPTEGQIYLNRAYSFEQMGDFEKAQPAYRSFLIADLQHASHLMRGMVARRIGDLAEYQTSEAFQDQGRKRFRQDP